MNLPAVSRRGIKTEKGHHTEDLRQSLKQGGFKREELIDDTA
jgi:hypothetical protein